MGKAATEFKTPYQDLLPPLTLEEKIALQADIVANGVHHAIAVDEENNILDGHHRYEFSDGDCESFVVEGLTPAEKKAYVIRSGMTSRNLSPSQKTDLERTVMKGIAKELREEDATKWTQEAVGRVLGVSEATVSRWGGGSNLQVQDTSHPSGGHDRPDARVKVVPAHKPVIAKRVKAGESQAQVAADYGVTRRQVVTIVNAEKKDAETKRKRRAAAKAREGNNGVLHGDFRKVGNQIEDGTVDLILTDPPYDAKSSETLYADLLKFAGRVLTQGGWVLAYSGKAHLPDVYKAFGESTAITYGWTFCILHQGGDARFRKFKVQTGWKPVVAGFKPVKQVDWDWFKDVVACGKREKDDHPWQQAVDEAAYLVKNLCPEHGHVCDPFAGSGTTLLAAKQLNRKWTGIEKDKDHVETARSRLDDTDV